jgi:hypothetical protein
MALVEIQAKDDGHYDSIWHCLTSCEYTTLGRMRLRERKMLS